MSISLLPGYFNSTLNPVIYVMTNRLFAHIFFLRWEDFFPFHVFVCLHVNNDQGLQVCLHQHPQEDLLLMLPSKLKRSSLKFFSYLKIILKTWRKKRVEMKKWLMWCRRRKAGGRVMIPKKKKKKEKRPDFHALPKYFWIFV